MRRAFALAVALVVFVMACAGEAPAPQGVTNAQPPASTQASGNSVLPPPAPPFRGVIGETAKQSKPDFPKPVTAPAGGPNAVLIMTADAGFGAPSTFRGPTRPPTFHPPPPPRLRF